MTANIRCSTSWKHSWDRFISGKLPKQLCIISARVRASCVFVCVCVENRMRDFKPRFQRASIVPPASFIPFWHFTDSVQMCSQYTGWWKPGWLVTSEPCLLVFQTALTAASWDVAGNYFSFLCFIFSWPTVFFFFLNVIPQQFYLLLESFPLSFAHSLYMPFYIPLPSNETLLFICPPPCTATLHCSFTLCSLPSSHCTPLPCIRFSSGI